MILRMSVTGLFIIGGLWRWWTLGTFNNVFTAGAIILGVYFIRSLFLLRETNRILAKVDELE